MVRSLEEHSREAIKLLDKKYKLAYTIVNQKAGIFKIHDAVYKIASPWIPSYKIKVNFKWFVDSSNKEKPYLPRYESIRVDYYLI